MKALFKNFIAILLIFLTVSALFSLFLNPSEEIKELSITQLAEDINQEKIEEIAVSENNLEIVYRDGSKAKSQKEVESTLSESLANYGVGKESLSKIEVEIIDVSGDWIWLGPIIFSVLPLLVMGLFLWFILKQSKTGKMQAFDFTKTKARLFGAGGLPKEKITFEDVAGQKEAKEELKEVVDFLKNPKKYLKMGARIPRGVLLLGPSGVGKTLLAKAVAGEADVPFFSISGSEFVEMFVGVGAGRVRSLFTTAKKAGTSIIFIDELDAVGRMRGAGIGGGHDEREQTLNQLLVEMDGFEGNDTRIVLAATNRPDILDKALLRPGRFDRRVVLNLPDINDREDVLKIHCRKKPLALDIKLRETAERTPGFSGADLANVVNEAAILAARKNRSKIFQEDFLNSIDKVLLGPERKSHILSKKEKRIAAFHEAGHALVSTILLESEPIRKVSIIARGFAAGYTLKVPREEKKMATKTEFLARMAVLLGGYCAEKLKFGEITTGASDDLNRASDLARRLVKEFGMSSFGPISFGEREGMVFLGKGISEHRNYSEKTAFLIDKEVAKFINLAEKQAKKVLIKKKKLLEKIANALIEKEILEREAFEELVGIKKEDKKQKDLKVKKEKVIKVKVESL